MCLELRLTTKHKQSKEVKELTNALSFPISFDFIHNYAFNAKQKNFFFVNIKKIKFLCKLCLGFFLKVKRAQKKWFLNETYSRKKKSDKGGEEKKRERTQQKYKNIKIATKETQQNEANSTYNEIITELSGQRRETY